MPDFMKQKKGILLIIAVVLFLWVLFKPNSCNKISQEEFSTDLLQDKDEITNDLSIILNFVEENCNEKVDIEYHLNTDKLIIHKCDTGEIKEEVKNEIFRIMKKWDIDYVYNQNQDICYSFFKVDKKSEKRPEGVFLLYSKNFKDSEYKLIEKINSNWFLVKKSIVP